jgi:hypothetical protein
MKDKTVEYHLRAEELAVTLGGFGLGSFLVLILQQLSKVKVLGKTCKTKVTRESWKHDDEEV